MTDVHDHDRGLAFDLPRLLNRRRMLTVMAGAGLATLVGCGKDSGSSAAPSTTGAAASSATTAAAAGSAANCSTPIPTETAGPFPGDGSNGPNVLSQSGVVRSDIRSSFGSASGTAEGVPLSINLTVLDVEKNCAAYEGAAVYLWHCDREGRYSLYSQGVTDQNYLRGVQVADASGRVTFKSIFPGCYSGRWPHVHFEVYPSLDAAQRRSGARTSQLALPADVCQTVYATSGYGQSVRNLAQTSLQRDMVFADGYSQQLATTSGSVSAGYTAALTVPV